MCNADSSTFSSGQDDLGIYVSFTIDTEVYTRATIFKTAYWFTDQYYLFLTKITGTNRFQVEIRPKNADTSLEALNAACGEFNNHLLDQEVRQQVVQETAAIRDTLIKKAFFEAKAVLPANTISSESHLPTSTQPYIEDAVRIEER